MGLDILDVMDSTKDLLNRHVDWRKILFAEWEMSPLQELFYVQLAETNIDFADAVTNDVTEDFIKYFQYRIRTKANVNLILVGEQGSGKSTFAAAVFLFLQGLYKEMRNLIFENWNLTFTTAETLDAYSKIKKNAIIFQDEDDSLQGAGSRSILEKLGNIVKRVRAWEISLLICCPTLSTIAGCDYAILPFGFHKEGAEKFRSTGDSSDTFARALLYVKSKFARDTYKLQGCVFFKMGNAIEYMNKNGYHEAKRKSFERIQKNQGGSGAYTRAQVKQLERNAKKLLKIALKKGWDGKSKKALETYIVFTSLRPTTDELNKLKELTYSLYTLRKEKQQKKNDAERKKKEKLTSNSALSCADFAFDLDTTLKEFKSDNWERDVAIYKGSLDPLKTGAMFTKQYKISPERVRQIIQKVSGFVNYTIGKDFEQFYEPILKLDFDSVERLSGVGEPDFKCWLASEKVWYFISVKCLNFWNSSFSLTYAESRPEIEAAQEVNVSSSGNETAFVRIDVFNQYNKELYRHFISDNVVLTRMPLAQYKKRTFLIHIAEVNSR